MCLHPIFVVEDGVALLVIEVLVLDKGEGTVVCDGHEEGNGHVAVGIADGEGEDESLSGFDADEADAVEYGIL